MWDITQCVESIHVHAYKPSSGSWSPEAEAQARDWCEAKTAAWNADLYAAQQHQLLVHEFEIGLLVIFVLVAVLILTIRFRAKIARGLRGLFLSRAHERFINLAIPETDNPS